MVAGKLAPVNICTAVKELAVRVNASVADFHAPPEYMYNALALKTCLPSKLPVPGKLSTTCTPDIEFALGVNIAEALVQALPFQTYNLLSELLSTDCPVTVPGVLRLETIPTFPGAFAATVLTRLETFPNKEK